MSCKFFVLIVGFGFVGMFVVISFYKVGWLLMIIERALGRCCGGYFVGFFFDGKKVVCDFGIFDYFYFWMFKGFEMWDIWFNGDWLLLLGFFD